MKQEKIRSMCVTAIFAALICIAAPFSVNIGSLVPISLATLAVYIAAGMLDTKNSLAAVAVYILLGAVGLPVFSGFSGGVQKLLGVTGGYIIGYLPLALIVSLMTCKINKKYMYPLSMLLGTAVLYLIGTVWFIVQTKSEVGAALMSCVVPFIPGDLVKIAAASVLCINLKPRLIKFISKK
ncbi:MAG: biotin transporter BioY [Acutalibacteraceae bacterium]